MKSRNFAVGTFLVCALGSTACGDDSSTAGSGGGSTSTGTAGGQTVSGAATSSSTGPGPGGDDATSSSSSGEGGQPPVFGDECDDAEDCFGNACIEVNGYRTCQGVVEEATECLQPDFDTCCDSTECGVDEICTLMPDSYCGGPAPLFANECVSTDDQCLQLDCGKGDDACVPPGVFGFSTARCLERSCSDNADCADAPGGACVPVRDPCCSTVVAFFCAYPDGGCVQNLDCGEGAYCQPDFETGIASCVEGSVECPA